ncbi:DUF6231 family protein [Thioalkalivibrio sulfidiphilus]|uniref:DUF6231 family protein n=1 Tax=Thioalkalivibrio sulfidiphilus TaxID=1033854 RepID=UPI00036E5A6C|nr:DUF6231 family protein [Thioalkalivibrio sulfidiphilus]
MDPRIFADLTHLPEELGPRSLLVISAPDNPLPEAIHARLPTLPITWLFTAEAYAALEDVDRHELVLVLDALTVLDRDQATHMIARLRDLNSESLYVLMPEDGENGWQEQDLIALGLTRVRSYGQAQGNTHLFRFNIKDYKKTPDWLNPRYWANPEMWEKARW